MAFINILVCFAVLLVGAQSRYVLYEMPDSYFESAFEDYPVNELNRVRRQVHGAVSTNADGDAFVNLKAPIVRTDQNVLSAIAGVDALKGNGKYSGSTAGLVVDNVNGHALAATTKHIPGVGDQLTGAAKVNIINNDNHKFDVNAFVTKTKPANPMIPDFNTRGANIDYLYKDKVGATVSAARTPFLQRTDVSAMGNYNIMRNPSSSLDLNAGYSKTFSPFIKEKRWEPNFGLSYSRFF